MPPFLSTLSTANHSAVESLLRQGVDPRGAVQRTCSRQLMVPDLQAFALAPTTRATFIKIAEEILDIATLHHLKPWTRPCLQRYFQSLLDKEWKLSSVLTRVRMTAMLSTRYLRLDLENQPWFKDLTQGLQRLSALDSPKQAAPISLPRLHQLLSDLVRKDQWQMAALLSLTWLTAGRLGEILGLPRCNLRHQDSPMSIKLSISKGVFGAQEKILPPGPLSDIVRRWALDAHQAHRRTRLFTLSRQQVISVLRSIDPALSGHSLRRGALQHADRKGVNSADIQTLSGHKSVTVLQRYLGRASSTRRGAMERTGQALQQL
jgi:integrase